MGEFISSASKVIPSDGRFNGVAIGVARLLAADGTINRDARQGRSPTAGDFLAFMERWPQVTAHGAALDGRVSSLEGLECEVHLVPYSDRSVIDARESRDRGPPPFDAEVGEGLDLLILHEGCICENIGGNNRTLSASPMEAYFNQRMSPVFEIPLLHKYLM